MPRERLVSFRDGEPIRTVADALHASFAPLGMRDVRVYFAGQTVSLVGDWMQMTAQAWVVWELSHSAAVLGSTAMLRFLPTLLLAPWSGTVADRLDRRRVLIGTNVAAMLLAFVLAVLTQTEMIRVEHLYVLSALLGIVTALDLPAEQAFVGDLCGMTRVRNATVLNMIIVQASRTVGPALSGWIIASLGTAVAFWLNGASFLAAIASLLAVKATQVRDTGDDSSVGAFAAGLRFVRRQPRVLDLVLFTLLITFFAISTATVLPVAVTQNLRGDAAALGLLMGSSGAGAVLGAILVTPLAQRAPRRRDVRGRPGLDRAVDHRVLVPGPVGPGGGGHVSVERDVSGRGGHDQWADSGPCPTGHAGAAAHDLADDELRRAADRLARHRLERAGLRRDGGAAHQRPADDRGRGAAPSDAARPVELGGGTARRAGCGITSWRSSMKLGLHIAMTNWAGGAAHLGPTLVEAVEAAKAAGFDAMSVADHVWLHPIVGGGATPPARPRRGE